MWVSTSPWQGGAYICYDLGAVMRDPDPAGELCDTAQEIAADTAYLTHDYPRVVAYRRLGGEIRKAMREKTAADAATLDRFERTIRRISTHGNLLGEYYRSQDDDLRAAPMLRTRRCRAESRAPTSGKRLKD